MGEISKSELLLYYKRKEIQEEIVNGAKDKEIAVKFGDKGFGKRPDVLLFPNDVLELAKKDATSFHASEELWLNPLNLKPEMRRKELDDLRKGWDLILDIDCKILDYSKIAADLLVKALKNYGIKSLSIKFSGNHGFHIAVPFESFPRKVSGQDIKDLFPDGARRIARFLQEIIKENLSAEMLNREDVNYIAKRSGKKFDDLVKDGKFNPFEVLSVDTLLISSRHMYRMPYCFNEKSGLISVPIDPEKVMEFDKEIALPKNVVINEFKFLDRSNAFENEAKKLFVEAFDSKIDEDIGLEVKEPKGYEEIKSALPMEYFPPCIKLILNGLKDGRKRAVFVLINFLSSVGWDHDKIENLLKEWNKKNDEALREVYYLGQLRYRKQQKKAVLPPNCSNKAYYKDFQVCKPDGLCSKIKNPVNYALRRVRFAEKEEKKKRVLTEEQKKKMLETRKKHKEFKERMLKKRQQQSL